MVKPNIEQEAMLFKAIEEDDFEKMLQILKDNPTMSLNVRDANDTTPLSMAYLRYQNFNDVFDNLLSDIDVLADEPAQTARTFEEEVFNIDNEVKLSEANKRKNNQKILFLLLEKSNRSSINIKTLNDKSLLNLALSETIPPSDLIFLLLMGANPYSKDSNGKTLLDSLVDNENKLKNENMHLHYQILKIGIPNLFNPIHQALLEQIMNDKKELKTTLFEHLSYAWDKFPILQNAQQKGQFLSFLLNNPTTAEQTKQYMAERKTKFTSEEEEAIQVAGQILMNDMINFSAAAELYEINYSFCNFEESCQKIIDHLQEISKQEINLDAQKIAVRALSTIYGYGKFAKRGHEITTLSNMADLLSFIETRPQRIDSEGIEINPLYTSFKNLLIKTINAPTDLNGLGTLLYSLFIPPPNKFKDQIFHDLANEEKLAYKVGDVICQAGIKLNNSNLAEAIQYYQLGARLDSGKSMLHLAKAQYLNSSSPNLDEALSLFEKSYSLCKLKDDCNQIINELSKIKSQTDNLSASERANAILKKIDYLNRFDAKHYSDQPEGILALLNEAIEQKNAIEIDGDRRKIFENSMDTWLSHFGDANMFLKINSDRQNLLCYRILENVMVSNPVAIELENKLINMWKKSNDTSSNKMLNIFYAKKLEFLEFSTTKDEHQIMSLKHEIHKLKPFYQRIFAQKPDIKKSSSGETPNKSNKKP